MDEVAQVVVPLNIECTYMNTYLMSMRPCPHWKNFEELLQFCAQTSINFAIGILIGLDWKSYLIGGTNSKGTQLIFCICVLIFWL